ncbi:MAG: KH domain-containing protein [Candidatus Moranbacteria bacterium]|nr:KH domain-containing protein [Candidatus Moranbacteria bacterium]
MMQARPTDQEFLEYAVKALVDTPEDVKVERKIDEMGVLITLDVNPADMGMVIGREGQTAKALRTILRVIGARNNARVNLKINEPEGSTRGERTPRPETQDTPEVKKSIDDVLGDMSI